MCGTTSSLRMGADKLAALNTPRINALRDELLRDLSRPMARNGKRHIKTFARKKVPLLVAVICELTSCSFALRVFRRALANGHLFSCPDTYV
jgi:hypothetical protein